MKSSIFSAVMLQFLWMGVAHANPTGAQVVSGTAALQQAGNLLQVMNSHNAIINWTSFSIAANEITRFNQPSAASAVLNRVVGQNPSSILGALQSNGRVFLINPSGIVFGNSAQIDVAGLVASTLNLSDQDFLAGRLRFTETPGAGAVVNQGAINAAGGGVYLVGPNVTNGGVITNPQGEVVLAAGKSVELVNPGTPVLRVEINAPDNEALNLGQILANSGRIGIFAGLVRTSGTVNADRAVAGPGGEILLKATTNVIVQGPISAIEGKITVEAGGNATFEGAGPVTGGDITLIGGGNVSIGSPVTGTGSISVQAPAGTLTVNSPITNTGGSIAIGGGNGSISLGGGAITQAGGGGTVLSVTVGGTPAGGGVTVNGVSVPLTTFSSLGPAGGGINLGAIAAAFQNAARVLHFGTGQVVGSLLTTSQINETPLGIGEPGVGRLTRPRASLVFE